MAKENLIDDITNDLKLVYVSDLKVKSNTRAVYNYLKSISYRDYTKVQWLDLANYLEIVHGDENEEELYRLIMEELKK